MEGKFSINFVRRTEVKRTPESEAVVWPERKRPTTNSELHTGKKIIASLAPVLLLVAEPP